jgi:hypothetical protein
MRNANFVDDFHLVHQFTCRSLMLDGLDQVSGAGSAAAPIVFVFEPEKLDNLLRVMTALECGLVFGPCDDAMRVDPSIPTDQCGPSQKVYADRRQNQPVHRIPRALELDMAGDRGEQMAGSAGLFRRYLRVLASSGPRKSSMFRLAISSGSGVRSGSLP